MVAHSVRDELERCLGSIRRHAAVPVTTILVDNASRDDTRSWVRAAHPEVRLIELEKNLGVAARDHGLRESRTPYTLFLDSDAALTPGALPTLVDALESNPSWGLVGPRLVYDDDPEDLRCVACSICANACPVDVIHIDTHRGEDRKLVLDRFDIEIGRAHV